MAKATEMKWKMALTSILEELEKSEYDKLLECLNKLPQNVKERKKSRGKMPGTIIKHYGLEASISEIKKALDWIPRNDPTIRELLRPFVDFLETQEEKENQGKKRKLNEVEGKEEGSAAVEKRKLIKQKDGQSPAADPPMSCQTPEGKSRWPWKISISELKSRDPLETEAFFGKVIQKSALRRYQNKDGKKNYFFYLGVADETASVKVMVYNKNHKTFKEGQSYSFRNVIKDDYVVKVTQSSTVAETKSVEVTEELEMEAQKLIYPVSELYSIDEAKKRPDKTTVSVEGTVEEIGQVEKTKVFYQQQMREKQRLKLKDETGSIWICMWGELTSQSKNLSLGEVVKMTNMKVNKYHEDITLNSTVFTKIHKVKTLGVQKEKIEIIGIIEATQRTTHLEAEFNQQVHTFVVGSPLLMKELDIEPGCDLQVRLVDKVPFIVDAEIKGNKIKKMKLVSMM